jgi:nitrite reductase (NADH) small subunit
MALLPGTPVAYATRPSGVATTSGSAKSASMTGFTSTALSAPSEGAATGSSPAQPDSTRHAAATMAGTQRMRAVFIAATNAVKALSRAAGAAVTGRGITGSRGEVPTIASPVHQHVLSLEKGQCLDAVGKAAVPGRGPRLGGVRRER